jgi:glyoxylase-like metal-dependent hydrolase (beta-lactamase superfamily II)
MGRDRDCIEAGRRWPERPARRRLLAGASALAALSAMSPSLAPPAAAQSPPVSAVHRLRLGAIEVSVISDGSLTLGLGFALPRSDPGEASALLTAAGLPAHEIVAPTNVTLVRTGQDLVLIDAGSGHNFMSTAGRLAEHLAAAGILSEAVSKVAFTHAHPDHLWGALDELDEVRFPNATFYVAATEWGYWTNRETVARVSEAMQGMAAGSARILKALEPRLKRLAPGDRVADGIIAIDTGGHTPGHLSYVVESGGERLLIGGDAIGHPVFSFERPDWVWGPDSDPAVAVATRRRTLDLLATDRMGLIGYHLPWPGHVRVERRGSSYRMVPV